jgi:hypothetical protein
MVAGDCLYVGFSLMHTGRYLILNYLGFTRKEKKVVEDETNQKVKFVNPAQGFRNLFKFYFDHKEVKSEFRILHDLREE